MFALDAANPITDLARISKNGWVVAPIHVFRDLHAVLCDWNLDTVEATEVWEWP
jgi:hypothetical protein